MVETLQETSAPETPVKKGVVDSSVLETPLLTPPRAQAVVVADKAAAARHTSGGARV